MKNEEKFFNIYHTDIWYQAETWAGYPAKSDCGVTLLECHNFFPQEKENRCNTSSGTVVATNTTSTKNRPAPSSRLKAKLNVSTTPTQFYRSFLHVNLVRLCEKVLI